MKYLLQNRKEAAITIAALIVAILDVLKVFGIDVPNISEEYILTFISAIIGVLVWYFNMPTSEENCRHTGEMRAEKTERKNKNIGEAFYSDSEEDIKDEK